MNNNIETYANITSFSNYQVSTFGNVKNITTGRILKPQTSRGYLHVVLYDNDKKSTKLIHKLVASAFLENTEDKRFIDHINRDTLNNHMSNLRYATDSENQQNKSMMTNNTSGITGVFWHKSKIITNGIIIINLKKGTCSAIFFCLVYQSCINQKKDIANNQFLHCNQLINN